MLGIESQVRVKRPWCDEAPQLPWPRFAAGDHCPPDGPHRQVAGMNRGMVYPVRRLHEILLVRKVRNRSVAVSIPAVRMSSTNSSSVGTVCCARIARGLNRIAMMTRVRVIESG
jgi:hypothetical protein